MGIYVSAIKGFISMRFLKSMMQPLFVLKAFSLHYFLHYLMAKALITVG